jgi:hypothetical protein
MSKKYTTETFKEKANIKHNHRYNYDLVEYIDAHTKIPIKCEKHDVFWQKPYSHLQGQGCPECIINAPLTTETFKEKANIKHNHRYNYDLVEYVSSKSKIKIECPYHGVFKQIPAVHLFGQGCPECGLEKNSKTFLKPLYVFIMESNKKHNHRYNYSKVIYIGNKEKVEIYCPDHGYFWQTPNGHLSGQGCPDCIKKVSNQERNFAEFIQSIYNNDIITNTRQIITPYELDVYLPDKQLAFEYNGMYWHEEGVRKPIGYHQMKTNMCMDKGVKLLHVWEDDWMNDKRFMKEMIKRIII